MKTLYLFYGFGGEYVLHSLYLAMSSQYDCLEIDALSVRNSRKIIDKLRGKKIVFITSAHFLLDQKNFTDFYPNANQFYSVVEIISLLTPVKNIFIPHDLTQPLIAHELEYLNQFDLFLSPCEPYTTAYSLYCPTVEVGWIKYRPETEVIKPKNKAIWFLSDFILHIKMGKEKSYQVTAPLLKQGISLKFPVWTESDEFTSYYRKRGVDVYDPRVISYNLIEVHDTIITNGLSSLIAESSLLGKTTINIMEHSHYGEDGVNIIQTNYPGVEMYETIKEVKIKGIIATHGPRVLHPFDMTKAINAITNSHKIQL